MYEERNVFRIRREVFRSRIEEGCSVCREDLDHELRLAERPQELIE
jgi:hypothetical protein